MKFTCLSRGGGFHFPPCHILDVCGFRILLDCPLDVSAITIFSPAPSYFHSHVDNVDAVRQPVSDPENVAQKRQKVEKELVPSDLVCAEPWYKTVKTLQLLDTSFIDIVLVTSPMGMLGLPFLTRSKGFSAKIYVTEAAARIGQLLMQDLVSMHMEFRLFYGPPNRATPEWIQQLRVEAAPSALKEIAFGQNNEELGSWMSLYSASDVKSCMKMIKTLRFGEETCYNGTLILRAFSSGLDIGACNWSINSPKTSISYISGSIFDSHNVINFDYQTLRGDSVVLYSDFSFCGNVEDFEDGGSTPSDNCNQDELAAFLHNQKDSSEEMEKIAFICSCTVDSVKDGGSVLITISRIGILLQLLEHISISLESSSLEVPVYVISSVAEELMAFSNTIPEWVCKSRLEKFIAGEPLFGHAKFIGEKRIHLFPTVYSAKSISTWKEPCIVFCPHWSLRLGPSVHLLYRWSSDSRSLLVLENVVDANLALLPFKPTAIKVLQCSFLSGIKPQKIQPLLTMVRPKLVVLPHELRLHVGASDTDAYTILHFSENEALHIPSCRTQITMDLSSQLSWRKLKHENISVARLKGEVIMERGKLKLMSGSEHTTELVGRSLKHWGSPSPEKLLSTLMSVGIKGTLQREMAEEEVRSSSTISIHSPEPAVVEVSEGGTVISTEDETLATLIVKAIDSVLDFV